MIQEKKQQEKKTDLSSPLYTDSNIACLDIIYYFLFKSIEIYLFMKICEVFWTGSEWSDILRFHLLWVYGNFKLRI